MSVLHQMIHLTPLVDHDPRHGHSQSQWWRLSLVHWSGDKVWLLMIVRLLPVLWVSVSMVRVCHHRAVHWLLSRHRRKNSIVPCIRVGSVLVELDLL